jgi:hypothetical protein
MICACLCLSVCTCCPHRVPGDATQRCVSRKVEKNQLQCRIFQSESHRWKRLMGSALNIRYSSEDDLKLHPFSQNIYWEDPITMEFHFLILLYNRVANGRLQKKGIMSSECISVHSEHSLMHPCFGDASLWCYSPVRWHKVGSLGESWYRKQNIFTYHSAS